MAENKWRGFRRIYSLIQRRSDIIELRWNDFEHLTLVCYAMMILYTDIFMDLISAW